MRKIYKLLFPLIASFGLFAPFSASATHVMGADITWKCLGNDSFQLIVHAYRDCNGIQLSGLGLTYQSTDDSCASTPVNANPDVCCGTDVTPVCNRSCDRCISNSSCVFPYGMEEWTITATVYLPPPCCNFTIAWQESARNSNITTGAANDNFYDEVYLNRCITPCASSPYFTNPPVGIFCVGQCIVYNPGVDDDSRDAEGRADSLAYSFGIPYQAQGAPISYIYPYSNDAPLIYSGTSKNQPFVPPYCYGFHLDSITGDIEFKAKKPDETVFVIVVDIYRRDSLGVERKIGEIKRDLEIIVMDCPADQPPIIPGINGGTTYSETICADKETCFQVKAFDLDPNDTDYLSWNNPPSLNGATFTVVPNGQKWPTAVFCWYPTDANVRSYPYTFIATAIDNACPVPGRASKAFSIYVIAAPSADYSATVKNCGEVYFQASQDKASATAITQYLWVGDGSPGYGPLYIFGRTGTYKYTRAGTYYYNLEVTGPNGCVRTYQDSVKIAAFPAISLPPDLVVCADTPTITVKSTLLNAYQPYNIWWNFKNSKGDSLTSGSITEAISHDTTFVANLSDEGCTNYDSMKVKVETLPQPNLGPDQRGCWGQWIMLSTGLPHMPTVTWTWINGKDTVRNQFHGDTILVLDSGKYAVSVEDSLGCGGSDTVNVYYNTLVHANSIDSTVCIGDSVTLRAGTAGPGATYSWVNLIHPGNPLSTGPTYSFLASGLEADLQVIVSRTSHGLTCADTGYDKITVNTPSKPLVGDLGEHCIDDPPVELSNEYPAVDRQHTGGTWRDLNNPSAVVDNYLYPSIMGNTTSDPALGTLNYFYVNAYGCPINVTSSVTIDNKPHVTAGPDTEICTGNGRYLLSQYASPAGGNWYAPQGAPAGMITKSSFGDSTFFNPTAPGVLDTVYGIIYQTPKVGKSPCTNSDTVYIRVKTNPPVTVAPIDTQCIVTDAVPLSASPTTGIWNIKPGDKTNPNAIKFEASTHSYIFRPDSAGYGMHYLTYTAYGDVAKSLCPTSVTVGIYVMPAPQNVDFHTSDTSWEYCKTHAVVSLIATENGSNVYGGEYSAGNEVYNKGTSWFFDPGSHSADTVNGNNVLYVLSYNHNHCSVSVSHKIKVDGPPLVVINSIPSVCKGQDSFEVDVTKYNTTGLSWSSDGSFQNFKALNADSTHVLYSPTPDQELNGKFDISVTAANHGVCNAYTAKATFHINIPPHVAFTSNQVGCEPLVVHFNGDSVTVDGFNVSTHPQLAKSIDWDFGDGSTHSQDLNPYHVYTVTNGKDTQQFDVTLTVVSDSGCVGVKAEKKWITVYATPKPVIAANPQFTTIALPQVQFTFDPKSSGIDFSDPNTTYHWTFGDSAHGVSNVKSPEYTFGDTGAFKVRVAVTSKGCTGDTFITVYVQPELIIYIPNVFKPDGKHGTKVGGHERNYYSTDVNNTFQPVISSYESFQMNIYNRWGQLMYSTDDPTKGWDGRFEGHDPVQDAYVYVIKATGYSGKPYTFTGTVTLLY